MQVQPAAPAEPAAGAAVPNTAPTTAPAAEPVESATEPRLRKATPAAARATQSAATTTGRHAIPDPQPDAAASVLPAAFRGTRPADLSYSGPAEDGSAVRSRAAAGKGRDGSRGDATVAGGGRPSRNRPCPCGSGRKYKQCHGSPTAARP